MGEEEENLARQRAAEAAEQRRKDDQARSDERARQIQSDLSMFPEVPDNFSTGNRMGAGMMLDPGIAEVATLLGLHRSSPRRMVVSQTQPYDPEDRADGAAMNAYLGARASGMPHSEAVKSIYAMLGGTGSGAAPRTLGGGQSPSLGAAPTPAPAPTPTGSSSNGFWYDSATRTWGGGNVSRPPSAVDGGQALADRWRGNPNAFLVTSNSVPGLPAFTGVPRPNVPGPVIPKEDKGRLTTDIYQ